MTGGLPLDVLRGVSRVHSGWPLGRITRRPPRSAETGNHKIQKVFSHYAVRRGIGTRQMDTTAILQWAVGQGALGVFLIITWRSLDEVQKRELKRVEEYAEAHRADKRELIEVLKADERRLVTLESKLDRVLEALHGRRTSG